MTRDGLLLCLAIAAAAALYSSVGHGGASAYIALMALAGLAPEEVRPAALVLNIVVAGLGACAVRSRGAIRLARVLAVRGRRRFQRRSSRDASMCPSTFTARCWPQRSRGRAALSHLAADRCDQSRAQPPSKMVALPAGAALGALAGLTGIGGGVYLSPLLVFAGWADPQRATGIAACFIVVNFAGGPGGARVLAGGAA